MKEKYLIGIGHIALTIFTLALLFFPIPGGTMFGSEGDWYSQHVGAAENIRQMMLETGSLLPQHSGLGGGTNIFDFAYYGLLRPDVIFSYFFPEIEMRTIISSYAVIGVIASVNLCFFWLKRLRISQWYALIGAALLAASSCFYHAHHQIVFVNFIPFLILSFIGIDRLIEKGKSGLMILSLFAIYMHSFFYALPCLVVCLMYYLYQSRGQFSWKVFGKAWINVGISIGLAAVFLLPTAMDILSTTKDAGGFLEEPIKIIDSTVSGLLYIPYGCGMTLVALYCLLLSLTSKKKRILSGAILICLLIPAIALALNGFLYPRAKVLIPFMPLIVMIIADTLQELHQGKQKHYIPLLLLCLVPALLSKWQLLILIDGAIVAAWVFIDTFGKLPEKVKHRVSICLLLIPICVSLGMNKSEDYLDGKDSRQSHFSFGDITMFASDTNYRFDVLANNYINSNVLPDGKISKTSMYSSITNSGYAEFYYDTMRNPISLRNRVVLMPNQNSFFNYFMGTRYLLTSEGQVPYGYKKVFQRGKHILAENKDVLPICYGTSQLLSKQDYDKLGYPNNLEALSTRAVVPAKTTNAFASHIEEQQLGKFFYNLDEEALAWCQSAKGYSEKVGLDQQFNVMLNKPLKNKILIINFHVESEKGQQIEITINGVKNNLSAKSAPYPNKNNDFTFVIPASKSLKELEVIQSKSEYTVSGLRVYTLDAKYLNHQGYVAAEKEEVKEKKHSVFNGSIEMGDDGYFVTSYPYKEGYEIIVDGQNTAIEKVNTTFVGFPIGKGKHSVQINFAAPGYDLGLKVSIGAMMALVLAIVLERKRNK